MKAILRSAFVVAAAASSIVIMGTSANAAGAVAFHGTAEIACFGCGVSSGTATLTSVGTHSGGSTATYTVNEPTGVTCVVTGSASGSTSGAVNVSFNWTRVGPIAVFTTSGDINGAGVAAFKVTEPVGLPCGGAVKAQVFGAIVGA